MYCDLVTINNSYILAYCNLIKQNFCILVHLYMATMKLYVHIFYCSVLLFDNYEIFLYSSVLQIDNTRFLYSSSLIFGKHILIVVYWNLVTMKMCKFLFCSVLQFDNHDIYKTSIFTYMATMKMCTYSFIAVYFDLETMKDCLIHQIVNNISLVSNMVNIFSRINSKQINIRWIRTSSQLNYV